MLKIGDSSAIIEYLKKIPEDHDKNKMIKMIVDLKFYHYDGGDSLKIELKKNLFKFADKNKMNKLTKLWKSLKCKILGEPIEKKNEALCKFIENLLSIQLQLSKQKSIYDLTPVEISLNIDDVIQSIRENCKFQSEEIQTPKETFKLQDFSDDEILKRVDRILNLETKNNLSIDLPVFTSDNIVFDERGRYFLGIKTQPLKFDPPHFEFEMILKLAEIIKGIVVSKNHILVNMILHREKNLFQEKKETVKKVMKIIALMIGTFSDNLPVLKDHNGFIKGDLIYRNRWGEGTLSKLGLGALDITPDLEIIDSNAKAIFLINSDALMFELGMTDFWKRFPCILISSSGRTSPHLRSFLKRLVSKLKIPIFGIFGNTPRDIRNLLTFAYGNLKTASETPKLAINNFYWLGLMPNDIHEYNLFDKSNLRTGSRIDERNRWTEEDHKELNVSLNQEPVLWNKELSNIIELIIEEKRKNHLFTIVNSPYAFLEEFPDYLLSKLKNGDFIKL